MNTQTMSGIPVFLPSQIKGWIKTILGTLERTPASLVLLLGRLAIADVFWRAGETKVSGWQVTDATIALFRDEYRVPLLSPEVAAYAASVAEHLFPVLLVLGLAARLGAAGLLFMTMIIEIFVYPESWPDHLLWTSVLLPIFAFGPGKLSIDHFIRARVLGDR